MRFSVEVSLAGRRRAGRCLPERLARRGPRCVRQVRERGHFTHTGRAGINSFRFTGRLANRALKPGNYVLVATPLAPDGRSGTPQRARFRVLG